MIPQKGGSLILGASIQYEFGGKSNDRPRRRHLPHTPTPTFKNLSGNLELDWKAPISKNASANLSVEGWAGNQRGVSFRAGFH